jgi:hypothetical protein
MTTHERMCGDFFKSITCKLRLDVLDGFGFRWMLVRFFCLDFGCLPILRLVVVNGAVTITILAKSSLTITLTISTQAQSLFHRRQTKIKRTTIMTVLKDK